MFIFISKLLFSITLIKYEYKILSIEKGGGVHRQKSAFILIMTSDINTNQDFVYSYLKKNVFPTKLKL